MRRLLLLGACVAIVACATSPLGRKQFILISDDSISEQGIASFRQMQKEMPASKDTATVRYVQCVSNHITRQVPNLPNNAELSIPAGWEVGVFASQDVNAFALPGGKIGVFEGLLKVANTQDQLASVIGHEVAHVLARHSAERASANIPAQLGGALASAYGVGQLYGMGVNALFLLPYSRSHESEADLLGLDLMAMAGFDPRASVTLWQNMAKASGGQKPPEMLSTHPSDQTRIGDLNARMKSALDLYVAALGRGQKPSCQ
ncbi:M48 family metallopeptidase [Panacagrimonas sp.]|uniref:M48 family metallopeptidase n=1 Tax=Panacagrimonas sp. TaxID=2480088 RepID=UPI003B528CFC